MQNTLSDRHYSPTTLRKLRNLHFMERCRRLLASDAGRFDSALRLAGEVSASPAPFYYVTFPYAHRVMRRFFAKGELPGNTPRRIAMWREIMERVAKRMSISRDSDTEALAYVLQQPASSFFLEPSTAERLYSHLINCRLRHFNRSNKNNNLVTV